MGRDWGKTHWLAYHGGSINDLEKALPRLEATAQMLSGCCEGRNRLETAYRCQYQDGQENAAQLPGCALFMLLVGVVFWGLFLKRKRVVPEQKWLLWGTALTGPAAYIALELGWILTEEGRQPWISYYWILVQNAVNPAQWLNVSFFVFVGIYLVLGTTLAILLLMLARKPKPSREWSELVADEGEMKMKPEVGT